MFFDLERKYLVRRAYDLRQAGFTQDAAIQTLLTEIGAFSCEARVRCAIRAAFEHKGTSAEEL